ncbi:hypothetical protein BS50DRAFT_208422 [Corynespora cassiicola Philippines]|uniref:Uncharacterized protein n=1 Tax=Corynespora cassiicola Philippines TaxID=1448308 RepID=A0A2T2N4L6_CORCC|nr:hypothetical protein BS50DRAFT_208422 [Corynespora cassiicola Philippines]
MKMILSKFKATFTTSGSTNHFKENVRASLLRKAKTVDKNVIRSRLVVWKIEISALLLTTAGYVALIFALLAFDGQTQEGWHLTYFTRNTVLASLSTLMRMSLMYSVASCLGQSKWIWFSPKYKHHKPRKLEDFKRFDDASRGILGSIGLLPSVLFRRGHGLATLGATITIGVIAFDPFAQNILGVKHRQVTNLGEANLGSIAIAQSYTYRSNKLFPELNRDQERSAISGLVGMSAPVFAEVCPTGNCTWPSTYTLAMCSGCKAVTGNVTLYLHPYGNQTLEFPDPYSRSPIIEFDGDLYNDSSIYTKHGRLYAGGVAVRRNHGLGVVDTLCGLWFCMKEYNVSIHNGKRNEAVAVIKERVTILKDGLRKYAKLADLSSPLGDKTTKGFVVYLSEANGLFERFAHAVRVLNSGFYITTDMWKTHDGLERWFDNVAESLTYTNRKHLNTSQHIQAQYRGTSSTTEAYIDVRWVWIIYPTILVVAAYIHLAATMWQNENTIAWKSNPLVPLLMSLSKGETRDSLANEPDLIDEDGHVSCAVRNR